MRHAPLDADGNPILPDYRGEFLVRFEVEANSGDALEARTDELIAALEAVPGVTYVEWFSDTEEMGGCRRDPLQI